MTTIFNKLAPSNYSLPPPQDGKDVPNGALKLLVQQSIVSDSISNYSPVEKLSKANPIELRVSATLEGVSVRTQAAFNSGAQEIDSNRASYLSSIKTQREQLKTFQAAIRNASLDDSAKAALFNSLPDSIKNILYYLVWYDHESPQIICYGSSMLLSDFSVLSKMTKPYLYPEGEDIVDQLIHSIDDRISIIESIETLIQLNRIKQSCENRETNERLVKLLHELNDSVRWYLHGEVYDHVQEEPWVKQTTKFWGSKKLESNVGVLISTYIHGSNLLDQAIKKYRDIVDLKLSEQKKKERLHFEKLVDQNVFTHKLLYKMYKSLAPEEKKNLAHAYHPPYYGKGVHAELYKKYGARVLDDGSVAFRVYAPNAKNVSVVTINDGRDVKRIPMQKEMGGNWTLNTNQAKVGTTYQYLITTQSGEVLRKADPFAALNKEQKRLRLSNRDYVKGVDTMEVTREHESVVVKSKFNWTDNHWLAQRAQKAQKETPKNIYELHVSHWKQGDEGKLSWGDLSVELTAYCKKMNFTHVELFGVMDHTYDDPFTGYQPVAFFAPNHRLGSPDEFKAFVNYMHQNNIGVILDWVPGHFSMNGNGLLNFDGTALYEHEETGRALLKGWDVVAFNYEQTRVRDFLISNAKSWIDEYHFDGLRVDAIVSIIRVDLFRDPYVPHHKGGIWNTDGMDFLRDLNGVIHSEHPGVFTFAEDWLQQVANTYSPAKKIGFNNTAPQRGLGFDEKWAMPWKDKMIYHKEGLMWEKPEHRKYHRTRLFEAMKSDGEEKLTREISHDEWGGEKEDTLLDMVQGASKYPDNGSSKFADLRALYAQQMCLPGSKLSFMGNDFAQTVSWTDRAFYASGRQPPSKPIPSFYNPIEQNISAVAWEEIISDSPNEKHQQFVAALNKLFLEEPALWGRDSKSMQWFHTADFDQDEGRPLVAYFRKTNTDPHNQLICINNFGDNAERNYTIAFSSLESNPSLADLESIEEIFNTDDVRWGGEGRTNAGQGVRLLPNHGFTLNIAPQSGIILKLHFKKELISEVLVSCSLPPGKRLFARGSGKDLNWEKGVALEQMQPDLWKLSLPSSDQVDYKLLLDDCEWESGSNHSLPPGETHQRKVYFSSLSS